MKIKKFTLIELLAVVLIFGILASIGLSIKKPSPVKSELSTLIGMMQRARAYAIENRCIAYVKVDTQNLQISMEYKDPFDSTNSAWKQKIPGTSKEFGQGIEMLTYNRQDSSSGTSTDVTVGKGKWVGLSGSNTQFGIMFDQNGYYYHDSYYNQNGYNSNGSLTGMGRIAKDFIIRDEDNKNNVFLIQISKVGSYKIFEGESEITAANYTTAGDY